MAEKNYLNTQSPIQYEVEDPESYCVDPISSSWDDNPSAAPFAFLAYRPFRRYVTRDVTSSNHFELFYIRIKFIGILRIRSAES